jgi:antitoxin HicB
MNIRYPAIIKPQKPSGYFVRFPDIKEAITQGETIDECLFNAAEVLSLVLDHRIAEGLPVPKPSRIKGARMIAPDAKTRQRF